MPPPLHRPAGLPAIPGRGRSAAAGLVWALACLAASPGAVAQTVPAHAQGLQEALVTVDLPGNRRQAGVYSTKAGVDQPVRLAVLLPGSPSVVRPVVENGAMTSSRLSGNFLIRARRHLADDSIATLVVDCHSDSGDACAPHYQASKQRQEDVDRLIAEVRQRVPSITQVWLVGTSLGTISSSFMPLHHPGGYAGAIHTASITEPLARNGYAELANLDYGKPPGLHFFVHHASDPCRLTTYAGARAITAKAGVPLVTVSGGSGMQGPPCEAHSEHGFKGREQEVMRAIAAIISTGKASRLEIP